MAQEKPQAKPDPEKQLPAKQRQFIAEYMVDFNGAAAAVRAGYSPKSARFTARDLLQIPEIKAAIEEEKREKAERAGIRADRVLQELGAIAFADPRKIMAWTTLKDKRGRADRFKVEFTASKDLSPEASAAIAEISHGKDGFKLKFHSKTRALELLMRYLGLLDGLGSGEGGEDAPVPVTGDNVGELAAKARIRLVNDGR